MKIFGREPVVWIGLIEATIALAVVTGFTTWSGEQVSLVMAAVIAVFALITAYATHDTMLGFVVGLSKAVLALMVGFGANLSPEVVAGIVAFVSVLTGFFARTQTSPAETPSFSLN